MNENSTDMAGTPLLMLPEDILYEDNHLIAVNKKPSQTVQDDPSGDISLAALTAEYIRLKYHKPGNAFLGVAHRIDRPVSGVVLFARTSKALVRVNEMLRNREMKKIYWAVVKKEPPKAEAQLRHFITRNTTTNKATAREQEHKGSQEAILNYRVLSVSDRYSLLEIELITGRHHQIRAQLSAIGCPIRGDIKYGYPRTNENGSIHLHARSIELMHPVKKTPLCVVAPPPADPLWDFFQRQTDEKK